MKFVVHPKKRAERIVLFSDDAEFQRELRLWLDARGLGDALTVSEQDPEGPEALSDFDESGGTDKKEARLRALGEVAASVAHDVGNSLDVVLLKLQAIRRDGAAGAELDLIERVIRDAVLTTGRINTFLKGHDESPIELIDPSKLVGEIAQVAKTLLPQEVVLEIEPSPCNAVRARGFEIREALLNLLKNAADAIGVRGRIRISCIERDGWVDFRVSDDGPGVPPEIAERIFEPFFTTKEKGTGLGLSSIREIAMRYSGDITLRSLPGGGAIFELSLPCDGTREAPGLRSGLLRVLVVEDDESVAELVFDVLSEAGHAVELALDPIAARDLLASHDYDLVLTDLDLKGSSGWQIARAALRGDNPCTVALMTGWPIAMNNTDLKRRGVRSVLPKPFTPAGLLEAIEFMRAD